MSTQLKPGGTIAVILGGGAGTRLSPLTLLRAKPAVPIAGKYRLIDVSISNCINSEIDRIFVLTQFNSTSLHRHIYQTYHFGSFTNGFVSILAAELRPGRDSQWFQGTADAVRQNLVHLITRQVRRVLILPGDALYRMDFRRFLAHHDENRADISVAVHPVGAADVPRYGVMKIDDSTRITHFLEKPRLQDADEAGFAAPKAVLARFQYDGEHPAYLASMGMYVFNTDVLNNVLQNERWIDFGRDIIPNCVGRYRVFGYPFPGYWEDIGTIKAFFQAHMDFLKPDPPFTFFDSRMPIYTRPRYLPNSRLQNCEVHQSAISEGSILNGARLVNSLIGIRSIIREGTCVENSLIMGNDYYEDELEEEPGDQDGGSPSRFSPGPTIPLGIGRHCIIRNAILDKNIRIGDEVQIINKDGVVERDGPHYFIRDGIVCIPKLAQIPSGTVI
ncbi:MAG: glucose-1-phosphate adenylyltransferase [Candidatus Sumerlaeia bacterium]